MIFSVISIEIEVFFNSHSIALNKCDDSFDDVSSGIKPHQKCLHNIMFAFRTVLLSLDFNITRHKICFYSQKVLICLCIKLYNNDCAYFPTLL